MALLLQTALLASLAAARLLPTPPFSRQSDGPLHLSVDDDDDRNDVNHAYRVQLVAHSDTFNGLLNLSQSSVQSLPVKTGTTEENIIVLNHFDGEPKDVDGHALGEHFYRRVDPGAATIMHWSGAMGLTVARLQDSLNRTAVSLASNEATSDIDIKHNKPNPYAQVVPGSGSFYACQTTVQDKQAVIQLFFSNDPLKALSGVCEKVRLFPYCIGDLPDDGKYRPRAKESACYPEMTHMISKGFRGKPVWGK